MVTAKKNIVCKKVSIIQKAIGLNAMISLKNGEVVNGFVFEVTDGVVSVVEPDNSKSYIIEDDISLVKVPNGNAVPIVKKELDENEFYSSAGLATINKEMAAKLSPQVAFAMSGSGFGQVANGTPTGLFERKADK